MSIKNLIDKGVLEKRSSSKSEIDDLLKIVERDLTDSGQTDLSYDWQFGIAYNAALKLCNIIVRASDYRVKGQGHHLHTIEMIPLLLGKERQADADYLNSCRRKRNAVEYEYVGCATDNDVCELREFVAEFREEVLGWLKRSGKYI